MTENRTGKRIFLSYAYEDLAHVKLIQKLLTENGLQVYSDYTEIPEGAVWDEYLRYRLEASDFVIIFLSKNLLERDGFKYDYTHEFLNTIKRRNINLLPVSLDGTPLPSSLMEFEVLNLQDGPTSVERLIKRIKVIEDISFDQLSAVDFEELIYTLLQMLDFKKIQWDRKIEETGFDFIAEYFTSDPFGQIVRETWLIECKYYRQARFDLKSLQQIIEKYKYIRRKDAKLVLITNSQFNSVAVDFLNDVQNTDFIEIKTIDGFSLKNILARFPEVVHKFFKS